MANVTDPLHSNAPALSRGAFVGLSGAALYLANGIAAALAAGEGFGKFHSPIVAENDPAILTQRPALPRPGGDIDAYAAWPRDASDKTPGVVVVQQIWGVDAQLRDVVRRFAKSGFVTIAPNLFHRLKPPDADRATDFAQFRPLAEKLDDAQVDGDVTAGATWIRARAGVGPAARPPKVGVNGYCMGGGIALRLAASSAAFDAAAVWYGKVRQGGDGGATSNSPFGYADRLTMPLVGNFGGRDTSIQPDDVRELDRRLHGPHDIKIYAEAGHAFFDDQRERYVPSAAADAWTRTVEWLRRYLAPEAAPKSDGHD